MTVLFSCCFFVCSAQYLETDSLNNDYLENNVLEEVIVRPKKPKYSKKNNPAYDLMQELRKKRDQYDPFNQPDYSFDFHEKIVLALNDFQIGDKTSKNLKFLSNYQDTAANTFLPIVLISMKEKIGSRISQQNPHKDKTIVYARKNEGIDKAFNQENINKMLEDVLREVDIYQNDITLMQNRFVSPLSRIAGDYYHYSITDTVTFPGDDRKYVELYFTPVNPQSFSFQGTLWVAADTTRFIRKVHMRVPRVLNLNYIDNIFINQEFMQDSLGNRHKVYDDMSVELELIPGTQSFYGRRTTGRQNFSYEPREDLKPYLAKMGDPIEIEESDNQNSELLWNQLRIIPLSEAESRIGNIQAEMRKNPVFYWGEKIILILAKGYIGTRPGGKPSKFDIGPVNTMISYNSFEGLRLRAGGMTTGALSKHIFASGYVAYGFHDHKWKYMVEGEFSFNAKKEHSREFPVHSIRATHRYDVDMLGQHYLFTNPDNIFLSLKRKESDLSTYQRLSKLEYTLELENHFSVVAGFSYKTQFSTDYVPFVNGYDNPFGHYNQGSFFIQLRYAPGETFYQGRFTRMPINMDSPIFMLTQEYGPKGFLGSAFTTNITEFSVQKRFWFSSFGYTDIILKAGKVWSQVQFPALLWPNANLSYTIQPESYSLLNPMEFANDIYGSLDLTYWLNGWVFNRIPLLKKLKLREIFTFKLLMGGLSKKNNPADNPDLFRFPYDSQTHIMTAKPYMEIGAGIDNILTILRVDYVWRLTYRDIPGVSKSGLRVSLHFNF